MTDGCPRCGGVSEHSKSCPLRNREMLTDREYGSLVVLDDTGPSDHHGNRRALCLCKLCGLVYEVQVAGLRSGRSIRCITCANGTPHARARRRETASTRRRDDRGVFR